MAANDEHTTAKEQPRLSSRSRHHQQRKGTPRRSPERSNRRPKEGEKIPATIAAPASHRSGGGGDGTNRTARHDEPRASARSAGTAASLCSSKGGRGLPASYCGSGVPSDRTTSRRSLTSCAATSLTDYSTDTPRETVRTTTTMAMSTARAEATLAVLEAERAQLEHRLKKVEDELRQERILSKENNKKRGHRLAAPPRTTR